MAGGGRGGGGFSSPLPTQAASIFIRKSGSANAYSQRINIQFRPLPVHGKAVKTSSLNRQSWRAEGGEGVDSSQSRRRRRHPYSSGNLGRPTPTPNGSTRNSDFARYMPKQCKSAPSTANRGGRRVGRGWILVSVANEVGIHIYPEIWISQRIDIQFRPHPLHGKAVKIGSLYRQSWRAEGGEGVDSYHRCRRRRHPYLSGKLDQLTPTANGSTSNSDHSLIMARLRKPVPSPADRGARGGGGF